MNGPPRPIHDGDHFTSGELDRGEAELVKPDPRPEPPLEEQAEPWDRLDELPEDHPVREWARRRLEQ
jgi:hypothetical protein